MRVLQAAALGLAVAGAAGCKDKGSAGAAKPAQKLPADKQWTAEEIAKDPVLYFQWADARIADQINDRDNRLKALSDRLNEIKAKQEALSTKVKDARNIHSRLQTATRRADDEDRWPVVMGSRSFEREKAKAVLEQTKRYADERQALVEAYEQAVAKLDRGMSVYRADIAQLKGLREKLALDLERVKLSQGMEELEALRKTEAEISGFAKALGGMANESLSETLPPEDKDAAKVNVEDLLK